MRLSAIRILLGFIMILLLIVLMEDKLTRKTRVIVLFAFLLAHIAQIKLIA
jgi:hypothetical protein